MKSTKIILLLLSAVLILGISACEKDIPIDDDPGVDDPDEISLFVYEGLKDVYLWYDKVNKLSNDYFDTTDDFYTYLNYFGAQYESLFEDLLYQRGVIDRWSWIVDDWEELENSFAGISKTMGYDFRLVIHNAARDILGYIRYVVPGSPADEAGLERGDIFVRVNGQKLDENNYIDLLFNTESYYLTLATWNGSEPDEIGQTDVMDAVTLQENPVHYADVLDIGGTPTGYLVYNAFTSNFDLQLNEAFQNFKDQGVQQLILDLRYNGGGSIQTAVYLASMIHTTNTSQVFAQSEWNDKYNAYWENQYGPDVLNYYFTDQIEKYDEESETTFTYPIASLGIETDDVYVITSGSTASASELVINGLEAYLDVKLIGLNTTGKYVGSVTVKDYDNQGNINNNHKWAMQPIVLKITNADDEPLEINDPDFRDGLPPDIEISENWESLLPFGNENETLLKATIDYILGTKSATVRSEMIEGIDYEVLVDSRDFKPLSKEMYLEGDRWNRGFYHQE